jgi:hypothetical protein
MIRLENLEACAPNRRELLVRAELYVRPDARLETIISPTPFFCRYNN